MSHSESKWEVIVSDDKHDYLFCDNCDDYVEMIDYIFDTGVDFTFDNNLKKWICEIPEQNVFGQFEAIDNPLVIPHYNTDRTDGFPPIPDFILTRYLEDAAKKSDS